MTATPHAEPGEVAAYVQRMAGDLRTLTVGAKLDLFAYLLEVVCEEAAAQAAGTYVETRGDLRKSVR